MTAHLAASSSLGPARVLPGAAGACTALALCLACAESESIALSVPPAPAFAPVSAALGARCGSLDCHGRVEQNLRLYHRYGRRLDPADVSGGDETSALEHDANHRAVVALEPELLSRVWREGGSLPERLTFVRKARGEEEHEGGAIFPREDPGDVCVVSWLSGAVDMDACGAAERFFHSPFEP